MFSCGITEGNMKRAPGQFSTGNKWFPLHLLCTSQWWYYRKHMPWTNMPQIFILLLKRRVEALICLPFFFSFFFSSSNTVKWKGFIKRSHAGQCLWTTNMGDVAMGRVQDCCSFFSFPILVKNDFPKNFLHMFCSECSLYELVTWMVSYSYLLSGMGRETVTVEGPLNSL